MVASITISEEDRQFYRMVFGVMITSVVVIISSIASIIAERQAYVNYRIDSLETELHAIQDSMEEEEDEEEVDEEDEEEDEGEDEEADEEDEDYTKPLLVSPISDVDVDELNALKESISRQIASIQTTLADHTGNISALVKQLKTFEIDPNHYQAWLGDAASDSWSLSIKMVRKDLSSFNANSVWSSWDGTIDGSIVNRDRCVGVTDSSAWFATKGAITKRYFREDWSSGIAVTVTLNYDGELMTAEGATTLLQGLVNENKIVWKRTLVTLDKV
jgi:hypothetical protein